MNRDSIIVLLLAVFFFCVVGLILVGYWFYRNGSSTNKRERITRFVKPSVEKKQSTPARASILSSELNLGKFRDWINDTLSGFSSDKLQLKLSSAYWKVTDTEYILIRIFAAVASFGVGWLITGNVLGAILLAAIAIMVPSILLDRSIAQRQQKFHNQILDVLLLISGAVQAGYSLMQALDLAVKEVPAPASEEFGRVLREIRFGISLEGSLFNLAERMESDDMQIVVTAIIVNSQVGGNLSTVLESIISTIRDRMHLFGEIRSLTSYAKYVGNFLSLMPFILGFAIFLMSPGFFSTIKTSTITQVIMLIAVVLLVIGNIWIRRIVHIKI